MFQGYVGKFLDLSFTSQGTSLSGNPYFGWDPNKQGPMYPGCFGGNFRKT